MDEKHEEVLDLIEMLRTKTALIQIHIEDTAGKPISKVLIENVKNRNGEPVSTNSSGDASGLALENSAFQLNIPKYLDIASFNVGPSITVMSGNIYEINVVGTRRTFAMITATDTYCVTGNCTSIDYSLVGGGGGGSNGIGYGTSGCNGGGGGGAGACKVMLSYTPSPLTKYTINVGSGGAGRPGSQTAPELSGFGISVVYGGGGGSTSFGSDSASGGSGGGSGRITNIQYVGAANLRGIGGSTPGRGKTGGDGYGASSKDQYDIGTADPAGNGVNGDSYYFVSETETAQSPGGGGGGGGRSKTDNTNKPGGSGGSLGGGSAQQNATSYGGGGGGCGYATAGNGYNGCASFRMKLSI